MRQIEWPAEDIVMEFCWNGDPDRCEVVSREFLPDPCCEYCKEYDGERCHKEWNNNDECYYLPDRDDKDPDECCDDYEWNEDLENLREEPREPKKEDYRRERDYLRAKKAVREWWLDEWERRRRDEW